jgi:hypothetical protein
LGLVVVYCSSTRFSGKTFGRRAEGGQRRFVEARQDELLLARVGVDVAHREDARDAGLELLGVDHDLLALDAQAPFGDRAQLGAQAEEHQQHVQRHARASRRRRR